MLCHFGCPTQPWGQTPLQCCIVGRNWGARATKAPEDAIRPGRFPLLSTKGEEAKSDRLSTYWKIKSAGGSLRWRILAEPGVVRVSAHIKLISRGELEWCLIEALQYGLRVFSHVELQRRQTVREAEQVTWPEWVMRWCLFPLCYSTLCWSWLVIMRQTGGGKPSRKISLSLLRGRMFGGASPDLAPTEEAACCCRWHISPHGCRSLLYGNLNRQTRTRRWRQKWYNW